MTTFPLRAPAAPRPLLDWGRFLSAIVTVLDVFVEAEEQAKIARARYPHAGW